LAGEWPRPWYQVLFAPWRMAYIRGSERREGCVFCEAPGLDDRESLIVYRGARAYVILNRYPYTSGHVMVVPYRHVASPVDLELEELAEMGLLVKASMIAIQKVYSPHGFNIGVNVGEAAGAGIAGHVHVHVVPRWRGDTNFTVITAGTKVVPEALEETWRRLREVMPAAVEAAKGGGA